MKIKNIIAQEILDSRGEWTVEVQLITDNKQLITASVPRGKSTGSHEAHAVSAEQAVKNIQKTISPRLKKKNLLKQGEIDEFLIKLDGTPTKRRLGANAILGVSMVVARAGALAKKLPLWKHLRALSGFAVPKKAFPRFYMNVINGGLHAGNNLDFQEYLVIPKTKTISESVHVGTTFYHALGKYLSKTPSFAKATAGKKGVSLSVGDEGGYAPNFRNNLEPFAIMKKVAKICGFEKKIDFGMDAAASDVKMPRTKLFSLYKSMRRNFNLFYLEDPFPEEAFDAFTKLRVALGTKILIAGDDLTTTNISRMHLAHSRGSVNSVIIKPNQIGTVSEALHAVQLARKYGWTVVASHRSGETNDDFIADFAYGVGADGLKLGAPARGERIAKYNRLLEIERSVR